MTSSNVLTLRNNIIEMEDIAVRISLDEVESVLANHFKLAGYIRSDEEILMLDTGLEVDEYGTVEFDVTVERNT